MICRPIRFYLWISAAAISAILMQRSADAQTPVLSSADTMEKVFRDEPWDRPPATRLTIEAARNEVEGVQLVVSGGKDGIRSATLETSDLAGESGGRIPKSSVSWNVVGYVETEKPAYPVRKVGWWPDPLLPAGRFDVLAGQVQPLWINVRVPPDARPGLDRGTVTLRLADGQARSVPLEVRVWDFAIPKQQHLETCFLLRPEEMQKFYKLRALPIEMYEQWIDFCIDHRISVMLCEWHDFKKDMERLVARQLDGGGSAFCLGNAWFEQGAPEARRKHNADQVAQLRRLYDRAKERGWLSRAYVYCHDEVGKEQYTFARELYGELKRSMPDLRLMQTFYKDDPIPVLGDVLAVWSPNTGRYRPAEFQAQQAKGKTVWWYVCCGPGKPYANLMIEWPAIDHRLLCWQNQKFHVTGFLYWSLDTWRDNLAGQQRWPEIPWKPATWRNDAGKAHNGDGQLLYPGPDRRPLSSIRLENFRDGTEDYEYFWLLQDAVARLKKTEPVKHQALIAEAEKALAVDEAIVEDLTHFTQDPRLLRQARAKIAHLIETANKASGQADRPVSGTFSIVAADPETGVCGAAVASKFPAVGKVVPYARAGVGAFCTQHWHEPKWGERALDLLAAGKLPEEVLGELLHGDENRDKRQLAIIDMQGRAANRNPAKADPNGVYWGAQSGRFYACQGNTLTGREVIAAMSQAYEETKGNLADRLIAALVAGDRAGGDHRGRLAAGIRVAKRDVKGYCLELQVDQSDDAVTELAKKYAAQKHVAKERPPTPR